MLAWYRGDIADGKLQAYLPRAGSPTPQVKGSLFSVAVPEAVPYTGLLTTDVITVGGGTAPTCAVNGTLSMTADFWDMFVHRDGVLWAYLPGINVGGTFELDASGNGHHLYLTTTTIIESVDGTGTNWCNERGFTVADGSQFLDTGGVDAVGAGWRIPTLVDGSGCAAYVESSTERAPIGTPGPLNVSATVTAGTEYPAVTIKAPLGPEFQEIAEWSGNAAIDLTSWTGSAQTRIGPNGMFVYDQPLTYADAVKADRYLGYAIPAEVVHLWNAKEPTTAGIGPQPVYASASQQPDANGNLVTWPNYVPGRGVEVHPAYTQLAQNSKLLNAVAGSPGTGPDNWTYTVVDSPTMAVTARIVGNSLTFSGTASRGYLSMSQAMAALSVYTFSFNAICDGVLQIDDIQYCSLTGGTIVVSMDGVVVADENAVPAAGIHAFSIKVTAGAVGDTAAFRFGLGASAVATGSVTVYEPQLVLGDYVLPYVASGVGATVAIASTAATSAGNGLAIQLDARMTAALSAGGRFTAAALCWMGVGSGEAPTSSNNTLNVRHSANDLLYFRQGADSISRSTANNVNPAGVGGAAPSWNRGEIHLKVVQTNAEGTQFRVGNRRYTSAMVPIDALTWGAWVAYDGSMDPLTHLRFGYNSMVPIGLLQTQLWAKSCTDAEILNLMRYAI